jgi:hypothetical protein
LDRQRGTAAFTQKFVAGMLANMTADEKARVVNFRIP